MKNLVATLTLSVLTVGSFSVGFVPQVNAYTSTLANIEDLTTGTTFPSNSNAGVEVGQATEAMQVADVGWACETYYDGSWACCAVDSYGSWYCEYGY